MDIMLKVTISNDLKSTAVARCEELLVHGTVADNEFVQSAVIMRANGSIGSAAYFPDESTRQER